MNKKLSKIFAFALSSAMGMAMAAPTLFANAVVAESSSASKGQVTGSKTLKVLDPLTGEDSATFEFTLTGDKTAVNTSDMEGTTVNSISYFDGVVTGVKVNDETINGNGTFDLTFNAADTPFIKDTNEKDEIADDDFSYYRKPIAFDFSAVDWNQGAGAYVYTVDETDEGGYNKTGGAYTIYVYVANKLKDGSTDLDTNENGTPKLEIDSVVVTDSDGNKQGGGSGDDSDDKDDYVPEDPNNPGNAGGEDGSFTSKGDFDFWNEENAQALVITKTVKGNQASTTKEFAFTIELKGADGTYKITGDGDGGADYAPEINVKDGVGTGTIYLKHGEKATIYIPEKVQYTITEANEGYTVSVTDDDNSTITEAVVKGTMDANGNTVAYTNTLDGAIPTGVLLTVAPFAALTLAGIGGAVVVFKKKKNEDEE